MKPSPIPLNSSVGIVLATHAAPAFVGLHLHLLKKHESGVRVLIHDDSSPKRAELESLALQYGATFVSTNHRKTATVGDLSSYVEGIHWAQREGIDVVVKCSRRFIIDRPWSQEIVSLMHNTGYATATAPCCHFGDQGFGFRSEFVALHAKSWIASGVVQEMQGYVTRNEPYGFPEAYYHNKAREVHSYIHPPGGNWSNSSDPNCDYTLRSDIRFQRPPNYSAYAILFGLMGLSRVSRSPNVYWHDSDGPTEYAALAAKHGLAYTAEDFSLEHLQ